MFKKVNVEELRHKIREEERIKIKKEMESEKEKAEEIACKEVIRDRQIKEFIPKLRELSGKRIIVKRDVYVSFEGYEPRIFMIDVLKVSDNDKWVLCRGEKEFVKPVGELFDEFVDSFSDREKGVAE